MKTELINNIANEAICQLQYYKNLYLALERINKLLLILFSTKNMRLIAFHVY